MIFAIVIGCIVCTYNRYYNFVCNRSDRLISVCYFESYSSKIIIIVRKLLRLKTHVGCSNIFSSSRDLTINKNCIFCRCESEVFCYIVQVAFCCCRVSLNCMVISIIYSGIAGSNDFYRHVDRIDGQLACSKYRNIVIIRNVFTGSIGNSITYCSLFTFRSSERSIVCSYIGSLCRSICNRKCITFSEACNCVSSYSIFAFSFSTSCIFCCNSSRKSITRLLCSIIWNRLISNSYCKVCLGYCQCSKCFCNSIVGFLSSIVISFCTPSNGVGIIT